MIRRYLPVALALLSLTGCSAQATADTAPRSDSDAPVETAEADGEQAPHVEDPAELPPHEQPPPRDRQYDISEVYQEGCVSCHGERGDGQGTEQEAFSFDTPATEWTNDPSIDGILQTLEYGIHDTAMQQFPRLTNDDRVALAQYVLELRLELKGEDSPHDAPAGSDDEGDGDES